MLSLSVPTLSGCTSTTSLKVMPGGGKTYIYRHFGGAKALSCYINLQITDSVGGKSCKFSFGGMAPRVPGMYVSDAN